MAAPLFRTILCPVDFSELSREALRYAAALARCGGATLAVLYANEFTPPPYFSEGQLVDLERQFRESFHQAEEALGKFTADTIGAAHDRVETIVLEAGRQMRSKPPPHK